MYSGETEDVKSVRLTHVRKSDVIRNVILSDNPVGARGIEAISNLLKEKGDKLTIKLSNNKGEMRR